MKEKTIDELISAQKTAIRLSGKIQDEYSIDYVSIVDIYNEIALLTSNMKSDINTFVVKKEPEITIENANKLVAILRRFDEKARNIYLYEYKVRPLLKEKLKYLKSVKIIDGKQLLNYQGEEFISVVYQSLLERTPEAAAMENALSFLNRTENHRLDFIYFVYRSEEANGKNIRLKGLCHQKLLLTGKRKIYSIPVVGYITKWFVNIILLPKRLVNYQECLNTLTCNINNNNKNLDVLNTGLSQLQSELQKQQTENEIIKTLMTELKQKNEELSAIGYKLTDLQNQYSAAQNEFNYTLNNVKKEIVKIDKQVVEWKKEIVAAEMRKKDIKVLLDDFYVKYNEKLLPDSRESVQTSYAPYIERLNSVYSNVNDRAELNILDLGCGEGEWLETLANGNYLSAIGVDNNNEVVNKMKRQYPNLKIIQNDAMKYLKKCQDNSIDILTSFHMVEHFELVDLLEFINECHRVLKKDGVLIIETPNPQNLLIATYYFYLDPTHKKPIPPELLEHMVQESGFAISEKIFLRPLNFEPYEYKEEDPIKDIVFRFNLEQAYAIWAVKK